MLCQDVFTIKTLQTISEEVFLIFTLCFIGHKSVKVFYVDIM